MKSLALNSLGMDPLATKSLGPNSSERPRLITELTSLTQSVIGGLRCRPDDCLCVIYPASYLMRAVLILLSDGSLMVEVP